mgnify:CR=1 FL=1
MDMHHHERVVSKDKAGLDVIERVVLELAVEAIRAFQALAFARSFAEGVRVKVVREMVQDRSRVFHLLYQIEKHCY